MSWLKSLVLGAGGASSGLSAPRPAGWVWVLGHHGAPPQGLAAAGAALGRLLTPGPQRLLREKGLRVSPPDAAPAPQQRCPEH